MTELTLNIANSNGRKFTILAENENLVKSVVAVKENNTITQADAKILQQVASKNGDIGILESCDLSGNHKLKLAEMNDFGEYYDIKLSEDGKMFQVTIKKTGFFTPNPTLDTIKADFGIADHVLVGKGNIPYGNEELIQKRSKLGSSVDGRNTNYNFTKLEPGDTINLPVANINIDGSPRGFFGRHMLQ